MIRMDNGGISLPGVFARRYASSDGPALKVAVFLMLNGEAEPEFIASSLGMSPEVVKRSLEYWEDAGLLTDDSQVSPSPAAAPEKRKPRLNHSDMARAVLEDPSLGALLRESQRVLGRELSMSESRLLIEIYEETGLPVPVLLTAEGYWNANAKDGKTLSRMVRTAREWQKLGIDTLPAAECRIELMEQRSRNHARAAKVLGVPEEDLSSSERKRIDQWFEEYGYDEAFIDEVLLRKPDAGIPYIHTVLKDWHKKGYATIADTRTSPVNVQPPVSDGRSDGIDPFILQVLQNLESED